VSRKKRHDPDDAPTPLLDENGRYNPDEFIVPAQDEKGHSSRTTVRVASELERDIDIIIQSRVFPYKTSGDLLRHGLVRHLEFLHRLEKGFPKHLLMAHMAQMDLLREEEMRLAGHLVFKKLQDQVEAYLAAGEPGEARRVAAIIIARLVGVSDTAWRRKFERRFRRQYASLLDGDPVIMSGDDE
jgi:hypothetical protein